SIFFMELLHVRPKGRLRSAAGQTAASRAHENGPGIASGALMVVRSFRERTLLVVSPRKSREVSPLAERADHHVHLPTAGFGLTRSFHGKGCTISTGLVLTRSPRIPSKTDA